MSLKITLSRSEHVLRSVGDRPNGIVGWTAELDNDGGGQGRVVVSGRMNPAGPLQIVGEAGDVREATDEQQLEVVEAVDALEGTEAGRYLWGQACACFTAITAEAVPHGRLEQIGAVLGDLIELRDALGDRFLEDA